jgi:flagellar biosynthesis protein FlhG
MNITPLQTADARQDVRTNALRRITVASGKGGVGKTWFSITLAHSLAFAGDRTLLVDGDLGLANVDVQLGIAPAHDLAGVVAGKVTLDDAISAFAGGAPNDAKTESTQVGSRGGFDVLAGRSGGGALAALSKLELTGLALGLDALTNAYDRVVVDLGAGVDQAVTTLSAHGDPDLNSEDHAILVLLTDEPTSLTDAYAFIKLMAMRGRASNIRVVVNMAFNEAKGKRTYESLSRACQSFLKIEPPLAGIIRTDPKVKDAIKRQTGLLVRHPQSNAAKDVEKIATRLRSV